jgi:hypothetical protein
MATNRRSYLCLLALISFAAGALRAQAADSAVARDSTPAVLVGRVVDGAGAGLAGAEITMLKSGRVHSISGDSGDFRISGLPPGTVVFNVRRIGFEAASFTAVLKPGRTHRANFALNASAQVLPKVSIADTAVQTHWLDVFNNRKSGARGTFITRNEIVKRGARTATDILRNVPGVRVDMAGRTGMNNRVVMTRGNGARPCLPNLFVHGMPYSGNLDDFNADDVEAVEVYVGISELPPELDKNGKGICGAVVVWTRDPRKAP